MYPENTLLAFEKAMDVQGLTGIELDIQLTRDGELVVIHDERVDRTTESIGYVRDYTLLQLKGLHIYAGENPTQSIPTMEEVFDLLEVRLKLGLKLNIELKNSVIHMMEWRRKLSRWCIRRGCRRQLYFHLFMQSRWKS